MEFNVNISMVHIAFDDEVRSALHRHLYFRETLRERNEIWYTDTVQRVLFDGA